MTAPTQADIVVLGGGHNGLVAACFLARAGLEVVVLERSGQVGGAAVSAEVFPGVPARLSKYAYLVSLMPRWLMDDLGLSVRLVRRSISSYTPCPLQPTQGLVVRSDPQSLAEQFSRLTGDAREAERWQAFSTRTGRIAEKLFPTLTQPLRSSEEMRQLLGDADWRDFVERPLGEVVERSLVSDLARGVVLTDALIGTFADADDPSLRQNICFLYHVIGNGTGQWDLPVGGMGALTTQLAARAAHFGVRVITEATVTKLDANQTGASVVFDLGGRQRQIDAGYVLANCTPSTLAQLRGFPVEPPAAHAAGAQIKVNMLLKRLPRLRDSKVSLHEAFCGTFHVNETYSQLKRAYEEARAGRLPDPLPAEIYCHSLSDDSILGPELRTAGVQTLTMFVLHTPHALFASACPPTRDELRAAVLHTLDSVLAEPIADCLFRGPDGRECLEINTTVDLEQALSIPGGNIFHTPLDWPWATARDEVGRWGVETDLPSVVLCGSGARRGGGVSGIPGHNAAQYVLGRC
jgi:phytoene dehydrogenase-like protein